MQFGSSVGCRDEEVVVNVHRDAFQLLISCQDEKQPERKDTHRKPLLPHLRVADVLFSFF